jgi:hypothetical protein
MIVKIVRPWRPSLPLVRLGWTTTRQLRSHISHCGRCLRKRSLGPPRFKEDGEGGMFWFKIAEIPHVSFFRATTYFINQKFNYNKQYMWKLKDRPG